MTTLTMLICPSEPFIACRTVLLSTLVTSMLLISITWSLTLQHNTGIHQGLLRHYMLRLRGFVKKILFIYVAPGQPVENFSFLLPVDVFVFNMFVCVVVENIHVSRVSGGRGEVKHAKKRANKIDKKHQSTLLGYDISLLGEGK